jgi:hypothetical protein
LKERWFGVKTQKQGEKKEVQRTIERGSIVSLKDSGGSGLL